MQYSQDYDETMPWAYRYTPTLAPTDLQAWDGLIAPYVGIKVGFDKAPLLFLCPSDPSKSADPARTLRSYAMLDVPSTNGDLRYSNVTGYPRVPIADPPGSFYSPGRPIAGIPATATTILLTEYRTQYNYFAAYHGATAYCASEPSGVAGPPTGCYGGALDRDNPGQENHFDGWNFLFADGHVKWMRPERTVDTNPSDSLTGTLQQPLGMWSIAEDD